MCGIAGFIQPDLAGDEAAARLEAMIGCIAHRGPDGAGVRVGDNAAIGMRRLSIIDLGGGEQPIRNEDETIAVVFNGEIYNYIELRSELESRGHTFRTQTDTEVLVHLYEESGVAMFARLRGMFAFALLDRTKRTLLVARDHFGQKPLYYSSSATRFAFASEIKSLLTLPDISRETDGEAFLDFVSWFSLPAPRTHFRHVSKMPPGHFALIPLDRPAEISIEQYWSYSLEDAPEHFDGDAAAAELDSALAESAKLHLRSDVPVGVLLSSGLDSRCIAAYAQEQQEGRLATFSVGFGGKDDELSGAAKTAREIASTHHALELSAADFAADIDRVAWHLDEPIGDPAAFAVLRVCELARGHVKVLLSGEGADEIFAGYDARYSGMLDAMARTETARRFAGLLPRQNAWPRSRWQRLLGRAHSSRAAEAAALRIEGAPGDVRHPRVLTDAQLVRLLRRQHELGSVIFQSQRDRLSELLLFDLRWQFAESLLQKADKMSMAASIELRCPFVDTGIAALAARMDSSLKLPPGGPGKLVLRKCLARRIPEAMDRPKRGFPIPLRAWLTGPLCARVEAELFAANAAWRAHLDAALMRQAWEDFNGGAWQGATFFYALWLHEVWFHRVVKSP